MNRSVALSYYELSAGNGIERSCVRATVGVQQLDGRRLPERGLPTDRNVEDTVGGGVPDVRLQPGGSISPSLSPPSGRPSHSRCRPSTAASSTPRDSGSSESHPERPTPPVIAVSTALRVVLSCTARRAYHARCRIETCLSVGLVATGGATSDTVPVGTHASSQTGPSSAVSDTPRPSPGGRPSTAGRSRVRRTRRR